MDVKVVNGRAIDSNQWFLTPFLFGAVYLFESVPEPSTFVLIGVWILGLLSYTWQRRKQL